MAGTRVREFHEVFRLPIHEEPHLPRPEEAALRYSLQLEETRELAQAVHDADIVGVADALADIVYVAYGTALSYGIDLDAVIAEVHRSNMTKLGPCGGCQAEGIVAAGTGVMQCRDCDGRGSVPIYREDGKVMKGPGYDPPKIAQVLGIKTVDRALIVGPSSSKCGMCGKGAAPEEKTHTTVISYGDDRGKRGCGVTWEFVTSGYVQCPDIETAAKKLRPDLEWVEWGSLHQNGQRPWL